MRSTYSVWVLPCRISGAAGIVLVAAVFAERRRPQGWSVVVPAAVGIASVYSAFSLTIAPWLAVIVAALVLAELARESDLEQPPQPPP